MTDRQVGFIGLGIMGVRMAANLQKQGVDLVVHNRTRSKADDLVANGALWANTPADLGGRVDLLFTMLGDPAIVREVALGENGFLHTLPAGALWVDHTTVNPSFTRQMAIEAARHDVRFLDAPVTGSKDAAGQGALRMLVGGSEAELAEVQPYLDMMSSETLHIGDVGQGSAFKMIFNYLLGVNMAAFAEGIALGQAQGIDKDLLLETLIGSPVAAPFLGFKRSNFENDDYDPHFPLQWMHKDVHLATVTGFEHDVPMPTGNAAKDLFMDAKLAGLADEDFSALFRYLNSGFE